jgi:hypothetical protein
MRVTEAELRKLNGQFIRTGGGRSESKVIAVENGGMKVEPRRGVIENSCFCYPSVDNVAHTFR